MVKSAKTVVEGVGILQRRVEAEGKAVELAWLIGWIFPKSMTESRSISKEKN